MSGRIPRHALGLALLAACASGCARPVAATPGPAVARARVEVIRPTRQTIRRVVEGPGQVEAFEVTALHARAAGYVRGWSANIGSKVVKGQTLAELDLPETEAEAEQKRAVVAQAQALRAQAEAAVTVAQADLDAAEARRVEAEAAVKGSAARLARWEAEFRRVEQLFRERAQSGSLVDETRSMLRAAEAEREESAARVKTAQAAVIQGRAALEKARADVDAAEAGITVARADAHRVAALLGFAKIVAPYDGVVTRRNVSTGHLTAPGTQGEPLFVVARSDVVTVAVAVPELDSAEVNPGARAFVRLQALPGRVLEGQVTRTAYALDYRSRTLRAEIDLPNPEGKLHPGLYAYVTVVVAERPNALTLPASAIVREGETTYCVGVRGGRAARLPLAIGLNDGTRVEVRSGLDAEELVVKANAASLAEGQTVEPTEPTIPAATKPKT